ncbi:MAG: tetratricopeptide repeat protein [Chlorobiaceae bacterium]
MLKDAMGGYRGTVTEISRVIMEQPDNAEAWYNRGNAWSICGEYDGAVRDYTMAINMGLRFREAISAYGNRGMARIESGDLDGAIEDFSEIIARKPKNRSILRNAYAKRALVKEKKGDKECAAVDRSMADLLIGEQ